jgi:hypothetical protein
MLARTPSHRRRPTREESTADEEKEKEEEEEGLLQATTTTHRNSISVAWSNTSAPPARHYAFPGVTVLRGVAIATKC